MLGEALRLIRVFHDLKQNELAERLDISQSHLSDIERCRKAPSQEIVARYAEEFDLPVSSIWFFDEKLTEGMTPGAIEKARGVVADKILDFLRMIERKRATS
ncbi:helix-turn-helix transcriptional regulator [Mesobacterium pallidum]|uniref:helix-turn-helix transcriptional regulator n=1 Tax=Mesobacterium pallidum TaxID=2872037 RepID=UPI001EE35C64|nr:helix-turn-helix transcriptional regulator [Mesobacterium pallidum]